MKHSLSVFILCGVCIATLSVQPAICQEQAGGGEIADEEGVWAERVQFKANVGIGLGYSF